MVNLDGPKIVADNEALRKKLADALQCASVEAGLRREANAALAELEAEKEAIIAHAERKSVRPAANLIAQARINNEALRKELADAKVALEAANAEIVVRKTRISELAKQCVDLEDSLEAANARIAALESLRPSVAEIERDEAIARAQRAEAECTALREASGEIGFWLSAALDDPGVCDAMKADIHAWFAAVNPTPAEREG